MARERRIESFRALRALWREDLATYHGQFSRPGFQAIAVHRLGVWKHGLDSRLVRMPLTLVYRLANLFVRNVYGIELALQTRIGRRVYLAHQHGITVAPTAVIGDDCLIQQMATIGHTAGDGATACRRRRRGSATGCGSASARWSPATSTSATTW